MTLDSDQLSTLSLSYSDSNVQPTCILPPRTAEFEEACSSLKAFSTMTGFWLNYADKVQRNCLFERMPTESQLVGVAEKLTKVLREKKVEYAALQSNGRQDFIRKCPQSRLCEYDFSESAILTRQIKQLESVLRRIDNYLHTSVHPRENGRGFGVHEHEVLTVASTNASKFIRVPVRAPSLAPSIKGKSNSYDLTPAKERLIDMRSDVNENAIRCEKRHLADEAPLANEIRSLKMLFEELRDEVKTLLKDPSVVPDNEWPPFDIIHVNSHNEDERECKYAMTESAATRHSRREEHRKSLISSLDSGLKEHKPSSFHRHPSVGTSSSAWMKGYLNTEPPCLQVDQCANTKYTEQRDLLRHNETISLSTFKRKSRSSFHEYNPRTKKGLNKESDVTLYSEHVTGAETFKNEPHMSVALPRVKRSILFDAEKANAWISLPRGASTFELERDLSTANSNLSNSDSLSQHIAS